MISGEKKVLQPAEKWFKSLHWKPFQFQLETWNAFLDGESGLLNAPTGFGKTYALWIPCLLEYLRNNPNSNEPVISAELGLQVIWITPLKALAKDIKTAMERACEGMGVPWQIAVRSSDTSQAERAKLKKKIPQCLITTPESLHVLLSQKNNARYFKNLKAFIVDEWHELLGTKRGVQLELALSRIKNLRKPDANPLKIWGISATIGNLEQALEVLVGRKEKGKDRIVRSDIEKKLEIESIIPEEIEKFPWAGHLGLKLMEHLLPIIERSKTTLLFTNTRAQTEIWYQALLAANPELAGIMAMHHGSLSGEIRTWVEESLHAGKLKLVVCTSSLDLGVDFRPVETVIQVGSPKGVSRFVQRAGRSGHQPGATSKIYFLPTHSLELVEAAAIRQAIEDQLFELRKPLVKSFDVLIQYLITLAVGDGFEEKSTFKELTETYGYRGLSELEWKWALQFITNGGESLEQYEEYCKVIVEDGIYKVISRRTAMRHRFSIGTIVSDPVMQVKFVSGGYVGTVEESFISQLKKGDTFLFAGRALVLERIKEMTALVRRSKRKTGRLPRWMGGRMPLSSQLSQMIRFKLEEFTKRRVEDPEIVAIVPLLQLQQRWSAIPQQDQFLIELLTSSEGSHIFMYPFAGRALHELIAALIAWRISTSQPVTFSISYNDYGFELFSDTKINLEDVLELDLFSTENLMDDILESINSTEMAKRRFREIAAIAGLVFQGYPGKGITNRHLQASSQIIYDVFTEYDPENLLIKQAMSEALELQVEQSLFTQTMQQINEKEIVVKNTTYATPFAFPILVDRLRESISSESIEDRIMKMRNQLEIYADNS